MRRYHLSFYNCLILLLSFAMMWRSGSAEAQQPTPHLDVNDVSWLFPVPGSPSDVGQLISMDTLTSTDGSRVWPDAAFQNMLVIADGDKSMVASTTQRIQLPQAVRTMAAWKIAALRIDPSAPGTSPDIIAKFGSAPQIRLILQPVTVSGTTVKVHDIAIHVLYSFLLPGSPPTEPNTFSKFVPDNVTFKQIVSDVMALKKLSEDAGVTTTGVPLGIHPGLNQPGKVPNLRSQLRAFLSKYLSASRLTGMALMGLHNAPQPWIFVAMPRSPVDGSFFALPSPGLTDPAQTAMMLGFQGSSLGVLPTPATNNRNPITGTMFVPPAQRRGVSTAVLFGDQVDLTSAAIIGTDANGHPMSEVTAKTSDICDIVSNPNISHFFNTDCISCHTATTRQQTLSISSASFAFKPQPGISGVSKAVTQRDQWNVRSFGWGGPSGSQPTATQRTANETAAVVDFINSAFLSQQSE